MKLIVYQCTDFFSGNHFFQVAYCIHIEYYDRQIILLTQVAVKSITFSPRFSTSS